MEGDQRENENENVKQTKGRQKIEMKRIRNKEDRVTTFFKRRSGIYKKAAEISALCGAEVAFGTFSPAGNAFTFATSSMEAITDRFLINPPAPTGLGQEASASAASVERLKESYNDLEARLTAERKLSKAVEAEEQPAAEIEWWETPVELLSLEELQEMGQYTREFHKKVCDHINGRKSTGNGASSSAPAGHGGGGGGRDAGENPN